MFRRKNPYTKQNKKKQHIDLVGKTLVVTALPLSTMGIDILFGDIEKAEASTIKMTADLVHGDTLVIDGKEYWVVGQHIDGVKIMAKNEIQIPFSNYSNLYNVTDTLNIGYKLNNESFYNNLSQNTKDMIVETSWSLRTSGGAYNGSVSAKVGLLTKAEIMDSSNGNTRYGGKIPYLISGHEWTLTGEDYTNYVITVTGGSGTVTNSATTNSEHYARPVIVIKKTVTIEQDANGKWVAQTPPRPVTEMKHGDTLKMGGKEYWVVRETSEGVKVIDKDSFIKPFNSTGVNTFISSDIKEYLNTTYYNSLEPSVKNNLVEATWYIGYEDNEKLYTDKAHVGLLTNSEWVSKEGGVLYGGKLPSPTAVNEWLLTPLKNSTDRVWFIATTGNTGDNPAQANYKVRPALVIKKNTKVAPDGTVITDTTPPSLTLTQSTTDPSKQVDINATATDTSGIAQIKWASGNQSASYFATGGTDITSPKKFTVSANGTYTVYAKDNAGNETVRTITISNVAKPITEKTAGSIIQFAGLDWILLNPTTGYLISKSDITTRTFDYNNGNLFNPSELNNIAHYLNTTYYNTLTEEQKSLIRTNTWILENEYNYPPSHVNSKVGLLSYHEWNSYKNYIGTISNNFWLITPYSGSPNQVWFAHMDGSMKYNYAISNNDYGVRPTIYLDTNILIKDDGTLTKDNTKPSITLTEQSTVGTTSTVTSTITAQSSIAVKRWTKGLYTKDNYPIADANPLDTTFTVSENGIYSVYVQDSNGNSTVETINVTKVNNPPTMNTVTLANKPHGYYEQGDKEYITWTPATNDDDDDGSVTYEISMKKDNGTYEVLGETTGTTYDFSVPTASKIQMRVRAKDQHGVWSEYVESAEQQIKPVQYYWNKFNSEYAMVGENYQSPVYETSNMYLGGNIDYYSYNPVKGTFVKEGTYKAYEGNPINNINGRYVILSGNRMAYVNNSFYFGDPSTGTVTGFHMKYEHHYDIENKYIKGNHINSFVGMVDTYNTGIRNTDGFWYERGQRVNADDTTAPIIEATIQLTYANTQTVTIKAHDISPIQSVEIAKVPNNTTEDDLATAWTNATGQKTLTVDNGVYKETVSTNGKYLIKATDDKNNTSYKLVDIQTVNEAPNAPTKFTHANKTFEHGDKEYFSWTYATDREGQKLTYELEMKTDSGSWTSVPLTDNTKTNQQITIPTVGTLQLRVRATDSLGLKSDWVESVVHSVQEVQYYWSKYSVNSKYTVNNVYDDWVTYIHLTDKNKLYDFYNVLGQYIKSVTWEEIGNYQYHGYYIKHDDSGNMYKYHTGSPDNMLVTSLMMGVFEHSKGDYVNNEISGYNTYVNNGKNSDGYWYVRGERADGTPQIIPLETQYVNDTLEVKIQGYDRDATDTLKYSILDSDPSKATATIDENTGKLTINYVADGTSTITVQVSDGTNTSTTQVEVVTDKKAPTLTLQESERTKATSDILVTNTDSSGIAEQRYMKGKIIDLTEIETNGTVFTGSTANVTENGDYTIYSKDKAGNTTLKHITIKNVNEAPTYDLDSLDETGVPTYAVVDNTTNLTIVATATDSHNDDVSYEVFYNTSKRTESLNNLIGKTNLVIQGKDYNKGVMADTLEFSVKDKYTSFDDLLAKKSLPITIIKPDNATDYNKALSFYTDKHEWDITKHTTFYNAYEAVIEYEKQKDDTSRNDATTKLELVSKQLGSTPESDVYWSDRLAVVQATIALDEAEKVYTTKTHDADGASYSEIQGLLDAIKGNTKDPLVERYNDLTYFRTANNGLLALEEKVADGDLATVPWTDINTTQQAIKTLKTYVKMAKAQGTVSSLTSRLNAIKVAFMNYKTDNGEDLSGGDIENALDPESGLTDEGEVVEYNPDLLYLYNEYKDVFAPLSTKNRVRDLVLFCNQLNDTLLALNSSELTELESFVPIYAQATLQEVLDNTAKIVTFREGLFTVENTVPNSFSTDTFTETYTYLNKARQALIEVEKAYSAPLEENYILAQNTAEELKAGTLKDDITLNLVDIDHKVKATESVKQSQQLLTQQSIDTAQPLIDKIQQDHNYKVTLQNTLDEVQDKVKLKAEVEKAEETKVQTDKDNAEALLPSVDDGEFKQEYLDRLNYVQKEIDTEKEVKQSENLILYATLDSANTAYITALASVGTLNETDFTNLLKTRLSEVSDKIKAVESVETMEATRTQSSIDTALSSLNLVDNDTMGVTFKEDLDNRVTFVQLEVNVSGFTNDLLQGKDIKDSLIQQTEQAITNLDLKGYTTTPLEEKITRLKALKTLVSDVVTAENKLTQSTKDKAQNTLNSTTLTTANELLFKESMQHRLNEVQHIIDATISLIELENAIATATDSTITAISTSIQTTQSRITDIKGTYKGTLQHRLDEVTDKLEAYQAVMVAESTVLQDDCDYAKGLLTKVNAGEFKTKLQTRLVNVQNLIQAEKAMTELESKESLLATKEVEELLSSTEELVNNLVEGTHKDTLKARLTTVKTNLEAYKLVETNTVKLVEDIEKLAKQRPLNTDLIQFEVDKAKVEILNLREGIKAELGGRLQAVQDLLTDYATLEVNTQKAVEKAEKSKKRMDYNIAIYYTELLDGGSLKEEYQARLNTVLLSITAIESVTKAEEVKTQQALDKATTDTMLVTDKQVKESLLDRLNKLQGYLTAKESVHQAIQSGKQTDQDKAMGLVNTISTEYSTEKATLLELLNENQVRINEKEIEQAIEKAKTTGTQGDIDIARDLLENLEGSDKKEQYKQELDELQDDLNKRLSEEKRLEEERKQKEEEEKRLEEEREKKEEAERLEEERKQQEKEKQKELEKAVDDAEKAVGKAEESNKQTDKDLAQDLVDKLPNGSKKDELEKRLEDVQDKIDKQKEVSQIIDTIKDKLDKLKESPTDELVKEVQDLIDKLPDGSIKDNLQNELDLIVEVIAKDKELDELLDKIDDLLVKDKLTEKDLQDLQDLIDRLPDGEEKDRLKKLLEDLKEQAKLQEQAKEAIDKAIESKSPEDSEKAQELIDKIKDSNVREEYQDLLDKLINELYDTVLQKAELAVVQAEKAKTTVSIDRAQKLVNNLKDSTEKEDLQNRLNKLKDEMKDYATAVDLVEKAEKERTEQAIEKAKAYVMKLEDKVRKQALLERLSKLEQEIKLEGQFLDLLTKERVTKEDLLKVGYTIRHESEIDTLQTELNKLKEKAGVTGKEVKEVLDKTKQKLDDTQKLVDEIVTLALDNKVSKEKIAQLGVDINKLDLGAFVKQVQDYVQEKGKDSINLDKLLDIIDRVVLPEGQAQDNSKVTFTDTEGHWAKNDIDRLVQFGLINSGGLFSPNSDISRAQYAVILSRVLGLEREGANPFTDIEGAWYEDYVVALYEKGMTFGVSPTQYNPEGSVTRQQSMAMLGRLIDAEGIYIQDVQELKDLFKDAEEVQDYAVKHIEKLVTIKAVAGTNNTILPDAHLTRAQMAKIVSKTVEFVKNGGKLN